MMKSRSKNRPGFVIGFQSRRPEVQLRKDQGLAEKFSLQ